MCVKHAVHIENMGPGTHPQEKFRAEQRPPLVQPSVLTRPRGNQPKFQFQISLFWKLYLKIWPFGSLRPLFSLGFHRKHGCRIVRSMILSSKLQTISAASDNLTTSSDHCEMLGRKTGRWEASRGLCPATSGQKDGVSPSSSALPETSSSCV